jgi:hypothetical protein
LQRTQALFSQSGTAGFAQSASLRHSAQLDARQKRCAPEPEQAAPLPQAQARLVHVFAVAGSQAPLLHAVHWVVLVRIHWRALPLSQQIWLLVQPRDESPGSHAPHCPLCVPAP